MYLHDYGDEAASFSKEEIQQGSVTSLFQCYEVYSSADFATPYIWGSTRARIDQFSCEILLELADF